MTKKWFKAKEYGWGWTPATWQGWLIIGIYLIAVIYTINATNNNWAPEAILYTVILLIICYLTGEKPGWRWGSKRK